MTALPSRSFAVPTFKKVGFPLALLGVSAVVGAGVSTAPDSLSARSSSGGLLLAVAVIGAIAAGWGLLRFGHRRLATWSLYGCALLLALPGVRLTEWMTVSDLFLLLGGALLVPELGRFRVRTSVGRGFVLAVTLIVAGGLLGTMAADDTRLSALNVVRLAFGAGATLAIFIVWSPSVAELRRLLLLVVASGLVTSAWALTDASSGRPTGLSFHPNTLALVCLIALGPAVAVAAVRSSRALKFVAYVASAVLLGTIVVSGSRAALAGFVGAVVVAVLLLRRPGARLRFVAAATVLIAVGVFGFGVLNADNAVNRLFDATSASAGVSDRGREALFSEMMDQIEREPLTGVGFASAPLAGHNSYLQLWAAGGILAFLGGLVVLASAAAGARLLQRVAPTTIRDSSWPLLAGMISLSGLLVALVFQNGLWNRYIWVTVAVVGAAAAVVREHMNEELQ